MKYVTAEETLTLSEPVSLYLPMLWSRTFSGILLWAESVALLSVAAGCGRHVRDARLEAVNTLASENKASEAIAMLDSIDRASLDDYNRHFHNFLTIKTRDKAYVTHTSDSLYLSVLDYFSSHKSDALYPEVIYYGGRVYSDLGDYPTALDYYHQALELLDEDDNNNYDLKIRILSQTAKLYDKLRLYDKAIDYTNDALNISTERNDTFHIIKCSHLLGSIYLRMRNFDEAEKYYQSVDYLISDSSSIESMDSRLDRASIKFQTGDIDSALYLINGMPERVIPGMRNNAYLFASRIYLKAGDIDRAYDYVLKLIDSKYNLNKAMGYRHIFTTDLIKKISADSLVSYISNYHQLLSDEYNKNSTELTLLQESLYNYQLHDRERDKAEKANASLKLIIGILIMSLSIAVMIILFIKNRNQTRIIELHEAIEAVSLLSRSAGKSLQDVEGKFPRESQTLTGDYRDEDTHRGQSGNLHELRAKLREKLIGLSMTQNDAALLEDSVTGSDTYLKLHDLINRKQPLGDKDAIWGEIERLVLSISPSFKSNLFLLTGGRLTPQDYHTALLIKLNVSPTNMSILLGRGRGTVNSRRATLCQKVFDENKGLKIIDSIIRQI